MRFNLSNVYYGLSIGIRFRDPQPDYSAFREASYGHSTLEIKNRTHAFYHWNRNDDGKKVATDAFVLRNQYWLVYFHVMISLSHRENLAFIERKIRKEDTAYKMEV